MTAEAERFISAAHVCIVDGQAGLHVALGSPRTNSSHSARARGASGARRAGDRQSHRKAGDGIADDLLTAALLAARIPRILAPAMNEAMYEDPATQANIAALRARGYEIVEPERGFLAERERGVGRLASEERILQALDGALARRQSLHGKRVAITAGPTREPFDPVRFLSNASTGATGIELAREAALRGATVTLLLGPTQLEPPAGVRVVRIATARRTLRGGARARGRCRPRDRDRGGGGLAPGRA